MAAARNNSRTFFYKPSVIPWWVDVDDDLLVASFAWRATPRRRVRLLLGACGAAVDTTLHHHLDLVLAPGPELGLEVGGHVLSRQLTCGGGQNGLGVIQNCQNYQEYFFLSLPRVLWKCWFLTTPYENAMHHNQHFKKAHGGHWPPPPSERSWKWWQFWTNPWTSILAKYHIRTKDGATVWSVQTQTVTTGWTGRHRGRRFQNTALKVEALHGS